MKKLWMIVLALLVIACASALANEKENEIVAMTILGEARGEGKTGMYAVACIISQRSINRKLTPTQVCLQNRLVKGRRIHQFSCWNYTSLTQHGRNRAKLNALLKTKEGEYAMLLASNIHNLKREYVKGADHYCTLNVHNYWTKGQIPVAVIGNHKFFKLRP
tara:strand:- start:920 stop:1405 length:486 start_codon:yes stop_codon:yes gene_type:complete